MAEELVVLRNFPDEIQANLAKGLLASQSIVAVVRRRDGTVMGPLDEVIRGVDLMVHTEDRQKAMRVLKAMHMG